MSWTNRTHEKYIKHAIKKESMKLNLEAIFSYHAPVGTQSERYIEIRRRAKELAEFLILSTPASPEQTLSIRKLQECVMFANAAIAINEAVAP